MLIVTFLFLLNLIKVTIGKGLDSLVCMYGLNLLYTVKGGSLCK